MPLVRLTTGIHGRIHFRALFDGGPEALRRDPDDQHIGVPEGLLEVGRRPQASREGDRGEVGGVGVVRR